MNCTQRIAAIFEGELVDQVPFVLKGWRIPQCEMERVLRNEGLGIIDSRSVYRSISPNVETETLIFKQDGVGYENFLPCTGVWHRKKLSIRHGVLR